MRKEEEEFIWEEIQLTGKWIKQHEERKQREEKIWAMERRIGALENEENLRIENRDIPERVSEVEVFFYPEEWEVLEQQPIKTDNTCIVQSM
jgi:GTP-dependent phosphoenolpyruvate carboxykinase